MAESKTQEFPPLPRPSVETSDQTLKLALAFHPPRPVDFSQNFTGRSYHQSPAEVCLTSGPWIAGVGRDLDACEDRH